MASKPSQPAETAEPVPAAEPAPEPAAEQSVETPAAESSPVAEIKEAAEDEIAKLNASLAPMCHPDGGLCDRYATDALGNILVPFHELALMIEHGFKIVEAAIDRL